MDITNYEVNEERQAFLPDSGGALNSPSEKHNHRRKTTWYLRLVLELAMVAIIVFLLVFKPYCGRDTVKRTPVPPRKSRPNYAPQTLSVVNAYADTPQSSAKDLYISQ